MPSFEVLGTGESVDPVNRPVDTATTLVYLLIGASVLFMVLNVGRSGGNWLTGVFSNLTGIGTDTSSGITNSVGGGF